MAWPGHRYQRKESNPTNRRRSAEAARRAPLQSGRGKQDTDVSETSSSRSRGRARAVPALAGGAMDPLSASPLRILDEGGALAVVLEHVPEDDALCATLVCTTFRDALFAQARHAVRKAGAQYAGKRVGIPTQVMASSPATSRLLEYYVVLAQRQQQGSLVRATPRAAASGARVRVVGCA